MSNPSLSELWQRKLSGTATAEEQQLLDQYLVDESQEEEVRELLAATFNTVEGQEGFFSVQQKEAMLQAIMASRPAEAPVRPIRSMRWWWAAAGILLLLAAGSYFWLGNQQPSPQVVQGKPLTDASPGRQGAILTLSSGKQVVLDSLGNGQVAQQTGANIILQDGKLAYDPTGEKEGSIAYNTMTTPRGRQFQVILPDGSKVWLNAASSITYPTTFAEKERKVSITGEAYFEVAKDKQKPFLVDIAGRSTVEVLGTHFNINAYADEPHINTTLLEGSVKVSIAGSQLTTHNSLLLTPGQQAQIKTNTIKLVKEADVDQAVAWKNGRFSFTNANLSAVMRQLARWYNVEVVYEGTIPQDAFTGEIENSLSLDQVLKGLTETVKYRIENGNKIIILQ